MKFTNGYWLDRSGMDVLRAKEVRSVLADSEDGSIRVFAPVRKIVHRGDTLNTPEFTVTFRAVTEGIIRVTVERFRGTPNKNPLFNVYFPQDYCGEICSNDEFFTINAGNLQARIPRSGPWHVDFYSAGKVVTTLDERSIAHATTGDGDRYTIAQLNLAPGERTYGLGERFGSFVKNGQSVDVWNEDGGTASEQAYKNVPFYVSTAGYGLFVLDSGDVSFEVGSEAASRAQFSVPGDVLDFLIIDGPSPKDVLDRYTAVSGRPPKVPNWSYGTWLSTSFTTSYDEATVASFVDGMIERNLPLSVFHFDCFWMREFHWCDFVWDPVTFPDPEGMLQRLKARGLKICLWINPYIGQRSSLWDEAASAGFLLKNEDGSIWQTDLWQSGMGIVDFTNPAASKWYIAKLKALLDMGVDCFKTDFGERIPVSGVKWFDGSGTRGMHNYYAQLYNKAVFDLLVQERGEGEAVVFARSATAGGQQFPVHWGGDCASTFAAMGETLRGGLSLAMSGFGYWSHDIGGFEGLPDADVFKRWVAFGMLSSHSRFHGSSSYRVPWLFDDEAVAITKQFSELKMRLMPYLLAAENEVTESGTPMMRPMVLEFPEDRTTFDVDTQYLLGPSLLVSPVFTADGTTHTYLPAGSWTHVLDGRRIEGGRWVTDKYGFDSLGIFLRGDTVLPLGARSDRPDYEWADGVTLVLNDLSEAHKSSLSVGGFQFEVSRTGENIQIVTDSPFAWTAQLNGLKTAFPAGTQQGTITSGTGKSDAPII